MIAIIKQRTRLPGCKSRNTGTLKPGYKYLRNGIGRFEHVLNHGYRGWRTSCDAFQTLICSFCWHKACSRVTCWTRQNPWCSGMGLLVKCISAAQKFVSSFSSAVGMEFIGKRSEEGGLLPWKKNSVVREPWIKRWCACFPFVSTLLPSVLWIRIDVFQLSN